MELRHDRQAATYREEILRERIKWPKGQGTEHVKEDMRRKEAGEEELQLPEDSEEWAGL